MSHGPPPMLACKNGPVHPELYRTLVHRSGMSDGAGLCVGDSEALFERDLLAAAETVAVSTPDGDLMGLIVEPRVEDWDALTEKDLVAAAEALAETRPVRVTLVLMDNDTPGERVRTGERDPLKVGEREATGLHVLGDDKPGVRQPEQGQRVGAPEPGGQ